MSVSATPQGVLSMSKVRSLCTCARVCPFLYLRNYWTHHSEILCAGQCYTITGAKHVQGQVTVHVRMCTPIFFYLRNYRIHYSEILCAGQCYTIRGAKRAQGQITVRVRMYTPVFYISETTGPTKLSFVVRVNPTPQRVPSISKVRSLCTCARASPFTIYQKPLDQLN